MHGEARRGMTLKVTNMRISKINSAEIPKQHNELSFSVHIQQLYKHMMIIKPMFFSLLSI